MPNTVFKDEKLEKDFNLNGYTCVDFLDRDQIEYFKTQFFETIAESGGPKNQGNVDFESNADISYDFTFIDKNTDYKQKVFEIITQKFQPLVDRYLNNYKPIIANYIRKKEGGGEVPMHQNWAFVDEELFTSVSIWVPLVDSNEENGTLQMVKGSHKRFGQFRGPMVPWELQNLKDEIVSKHLTPMNVKAGQAVILDDSIVHYSNINKTPGLRLAIQLIMIPAEANSIHYHLDREEDENTIQMFETDVDFYTHFHPWLKPKGLKKLKTLPFEKKIFTYPEFLEGLKAPRFDDKNNTTTQKIAPLLKDKELQSRFEKDGFVKIPLLNNSEVENLLNYYHSITHKHIGSYGFHVSLDSKDPDYIEGIFEKLFSVIMPRLNPLLTDYKAFTASYVVKEAGLQNIVPPHQDWSFVDEQKYCSATVWIPLMDVTQNNGALGLIRGSHRLFNYPRMSPSPQSKSLLSDHVFTLFPYIEIVNMKAGEALIFNNKTIHASPPNISGKTRIGAGIGITQKNATLLHYYKNPTNESDVEVYEVDEAFFKHNSNGSLGTIYDKGEEPGGLKKIKTIKRPYARYSKKGITDLVTSVEGVNFNEALMKELATLYNYNMDGTPKNTPTKKEPSVQASIAITELKEQKEPAPVNHDTRNFFQKYTPSNILAEIKYRLSK